MADENVDDEIQFVEFAHVAMQMEFDRASLDKRCAATALPPPPPPDLDGRPGPPPTPCAPARTRPPPHPQRR